MNPENLLIMSLVANLLLLVTLSGAVLKLRDVVGTRKSSQPTTRISKSEELKPGLMRFEEDNIINHLEERSRLQKVASRDPQEGWKIYGK